MHHADNNDNSDIKCNIPHANNNDNSNVEVHLDSRRNEILTPKRGVWARVASLRSGLIISFLTVALLGRLRRPCLP